LIYLNCPLADCAFIALTSPDPVIRQLVNRMQRLLSDPRGHRLEPAQQQQLINLAAEIAASWPTLSPAQMRTFLTALIRDIELHPDRVDIRIDRCGSRPLSGLTSQCCPPILTRTTRR
jgi:hypothetical protein